MTPQEKAGELVERFASMENNANSFEYDKQCALIAVDEIIENEKIDNLEDNNLSYWQEVKTEIEKL